MDGSSWSCNKLDSIFFLISQVFGFPLPLGHYDITVLLVCGNACAQFSARVPFLLSLILSPQAPVRFPITLCRPFFGHLQFVVNMFDENLQPIFVPMCGCAGDSFRL